MPVQSRRNYKHALRLREQILLKNQCRFFPAS